MHIEALHWLSWLPLFAVRAINLTVAVYLAWLGWREYRTEFAIVPRAVSAFLTGWAGFLAAVGVVLVFTPITDVGQTATFRAVLGAAFAGTLIGACWSLIYYAHRTPYCDIHDDVLAEIERRMKVAEGE